ncbi:MAG: hypothetical protein QM817_33120 [Archangium sp.]
MGFRVGWVATRNTNLEEVVELLGLQVERAMTADDFDVGIRALRSKEWLVVSGDGSDYQDVVTASHAEKLSKGGEAMHFWCSDTSMGATFCCYRDGKEVWSIEYDGSEGPGEPATTGILPPAWNEILAQCRKNQDADGREVDHMYDAAPTLGQALTGFRHDHFEEGNLFKLTQR